MNMDSGDANESSGDVLTSTMGGVLSGGGGANETESAPAVDSVPSSSSDASNVDPAIRKKLPDDPISSTSDVGDRVDFGVRENDALSSDESRRPFFKSDLDNEVEMFASECNLTNISADKITENVEDIVSDLENLLGSYSSLPLNKSRSDDVVPDLDDDLLFSVTSFDEKKTEKDSINDKISTKDSDKSASTSSDKVSSPPSVHLDCNEDVKEPQCSAETKEESHISEATETTALSKSSAEVVEESKETSESSDHEPIIPLLVEEEKPQSEENETKDTNTNVKSSVTEETEGDTKLDNVQSDQTAVDSSIVENSGESSHGVIENPIVPGSYEKSDNAQSQITDLSKVSDEAESEAKMVEDTSRKTNIPSPTEKNAEEKIDDSVTSTIHIVSSNSGTSNEAVPATAVSKENSAFDKETSSEKKEGPKHTDTLEVSTEDVAKDLEIVKPQDTISATAATEDEQVESKEAVGVLPEPKGDDSDSTTDVSKKPEKEANEGEQRNLDFEIAPEPVQQADSANVSSKPEERQAEEMETSLEPKLDKLEEQAEVPSPQGKQEQETKDVENISKINPEDNKVVEQETTEETVQHRTVKKDDEIDKEAEEIVRETAASRQDDIQNKILEELENAMKSDDIEGSDDYVSDVEEPKVERISKHAEKGVAAPKLTDVDVTESAEIKPVEIQDDQESVETSSRVEAIQETDTVAESISEDAEKSVVVPKVTDVGVTESAEIKPVEIQENQESVETSSRVEAIQETDIVAEAIEEKSVAVPKLTDVDVTDSAEMKPEEIQDNQENVEASSRVEAIEETDIASKTTASSNVENKEETTIVASLNDDKQLSIDKKEEESTTVVMLVDEKQSSDEKEVEAEVKNVFENPSVVECQADSKEADTQLKETTPDTDYKKIEQDTNKDTFEETAAERMESSTEENNDDVVTPQVTENNTVKSSDNIEPLEAGDIQETNDLKDKIDTPEDTIDPTPQTDISQNVEKGNLVQEEAKLSDNTDIADDTVDPTPQSDISESVQEDASEMQEDKTESATEESVAPIPQNVGKEDVIQEDQGKITAEVESVAVEEKGEIPDKTTNAEKQLTSEKDSQLVVNPGGSENLIADIPAEDSSNIDGKNETEDVQMESDSDKKLEIQELINQGDSEDDPKEEPATIPDVATDKEGEEEPVTTLDVAIGKEKEEPEVIPSEKQQEVEASEEVPMDTSEDKAEVKDSEKSSDVCNDEQQIQKPLSEAVSEDQEDNSKISPKRTEDEAENSKPKHEEKPANEVTEDSTTTGSVVAVTTEVIIEAAKEKTPEESVTSEMAPSTSAEMDTEVIEPEKSCPQNSPGDKSTAESNVNASEVAPSRKKEEIKGGEKSSAAAESNVTSALDASEVAPSCEKEEIKGGEKSSGDTPAITLKVTSETDDTISKDASDATPSTIVESLEVKELKEGPEISSVVAEPAAADVTCATDEINKQESDSSDVKPTDTEDNVPEVSCDNIPEPSLTNKENISDGSSVNVATVPSDGTTVVSENKSTEKECDTITGTTVTADEEKMQDDGKISAVEPKVDEQKSNKEESSEKTLETVSEKPSNDCESNDAEVTTATCEEKSIEEKPNISQVSEKDVSNVETETPALGVEKDTVTEEPSIESVLSLPNKDNIQNMEFEDIPQENSEKKETIEVPIDSSADSPTCSQNIPESNSGKLESSSQMESEVVSETNEESSKEVEPRDLLSKVNEENITKEEGGDKSTTDVVMESDELDQESATIVSETVDKADQPAASGSASITSVFKEEDSEKKPKSANETVTDVEKVESENATGSENPKEITTPMHADVKDKTTEISTVVCDDSKAPTIDIGVKSEHETKEMIDEPKADDPSTEVDDQNEPKSKIEETIAEVTADEQKEPKRDTEETLAEPKPDDPSTEVNDQKEPESKNDDSSTEVDERKELITENDTEEILAETKADDSSKEVDDQKEPKSEDATEETIGEPKAEDPSTEVDDRKKPTDKDSKQEVEKTVNEATPSTLKQGESCQSKSEDATEETIGEPKAEDPSTEVDDQKKSTDKYSKQDVEKTVNEAAPSTLKQDESCLSKSEDATEETIGEPKAEDPSMEVDDQKKPTDKDSKQEVEKTVNEAAPSTLKQDESLEVSVKADVTDNVKSLPKEIVLTNTNEKSEEPHIEASLEDKPSKDVIETGVNEVSANKTAISQKNTDIDKQMGSTVEAISQISSENIKESKVAELEKSLVVDKNIASKSELKDEVVADSQETKDDSKIASKNVIENEKDGRTRSVRTTTRVKKGDDNIKINKEDAETAKSSASDTDKSTEAKEEKIKKESEVAKLEKSRVADKNIASKSELKDEVVADSQETKDNSKIAFENEKDSRTRSVRSTTRVKKGEDNIKINKEDAETAKSSASDTHKSTEAKEEKIKKESEVAKLEKSRVADKNIAPKSELKDVVVADSQETKDNLKIASKNVIENEKDSRTRSVRTTRGVKKGDDNIKINKEDAETAKSSASDTDKSTEAKEEKIKKDSVVQGDKTSKDVARVESQQTEKCKKSSIDKDVTKTDLVSGTITDIEKDKELPLDKKLNETSVSVDQNLEGTIVSKEIGEGKEKQSTASVDNAKVNKDEKTNLVSIPIKDTKKDKEGKENSIALECKSSDIASTEDDNNVKGDLEDKKTVSVAVNSRRGRRGKRGSTTSVVTKPVEDRRRGRKRKIVLDDNETSISKETKTNVTNADSEKPADSLAIQSLNAVSEPSNISNTDETSLDKEDPKKVIEISAITGRPKRTRKRRNWDIENFGDQPPKRPATRTRSRQNNAAAANKQEPSVPIEQTSPEEDKNVQSATIETNNPESSDMVQLEVSPAVGDLKLEVENEAEPESSNRDASEFEDELVKAALEASSSSSVDMEAEISSMEEMENKEDTTSVKSLQMEQEKNEELALIQAAQESRSRDVESIPARVNVKSKEAETTQDKSVKRVCNSTEKYQKPLNIVVEQNVNVSVVKEAESTTNEDHEIVQKDLSSDDDKVEEYSSKMSQNQELKLTITKNKSEETSILKIFDPKNPDRVEISHSESETESEETPIPKLIIKQSPKMLSPLKITIKPVVKPEEQQAQKSSPKLIIKPIVKPDEEPKHVEEKHHSPKITIKPIPKPTEDSERCNSPKITIKPIIKPCEASTSPKIKIKPIVKPEEHKEEALVEDDESKERIVLKINKNNIPQKEAKKNDETEKLAKIKLKFSKEGGHAHIVNEDAVGSDKPPFKRPNPDEPEVESKKFKADHSKPDQSTFAENISMELPGTPTEDCNTPDVSKDDIGVEMSTPEVTPPAPKKRGRPRKLPLKVREDFKDPNPAPETLPTRSPRRSRGRGSRSAFESPVAVPIEAPVQIPVSEEAPAMFAPEVPVPASAPPTEYNSGRPKRSCRGPSVTMTLGIKPRKPRQPRGVSTRLRSTRGRGGGMGVRGGKVEKPPKKEKITESKLKLIKEAAITARVTESLENQDVVMIVKENIREPVLEEPVVQEPEETIPETKETIPETKETIPESIVVEPETVETAVAAASEEPTITLPPDVIIIEEETRMSADTSSRAETPAKQEITQDVVVEESQSSVQSTATTESTKARKGHRMEVQPEPESSMIVSAEQLAEYYWAGGGPYMLQEQVAQFLGIKSFKRKYPGIPRRTVDMQERDFIRETGLTSEHMCDLGLTAVNSADILDIMYTDFQHKYEEYCKYQREKQTKDIANKQKALSLAASQEKNKLDIMQAAIESAAQWNTTFNKSRRDDRKACMDLQTFTINYPKGNAKQITKPKIGHYPIALVPGQYTDYYKTYTPTEINNLPLNSMLYNPIHPQNEEDSQSDGSGSDSDSSTSGSGSSDSDSSEDDCNICSSNSVTSKRAVV